MHNACAAVVNDDARLPWLIVYVLVCALLVSQLSVCLSYVVDCEWLPAVSHSANTCECPQQCGVV
jgi:hypothetical protein